MLRIILVTDDKNILVDNHPYNLIIVYKVPTLILYLWSKSII